MNITLTATTRPRCWEIPAPEFIGVPFVDADGRHPHRTRQIAAPGQLRGYRRKCAAGHRLLPEGFTIAATNSDDGLVLLAPGDRAAAIYHRRIDGYLLHLQVRLRGQGIGHRFLAACLDVLAENGAGNIWHPGSYTDAGLHTSLRAHRLLVEDALARGENVPAPVLAHINWTPQPLQARHLSRADIARLQHLAPPSLGYKESMAVLALLHGRGAVLEAVCDKTEAERRPYTFMLALGDSLYQGFDPTSKEGIASALVAENRHALRPLQAENIVFRRIGFEDLCDHKHFCRNDARDFLRVAAMALQ